MGFLLSRRSLGASFSVSAFYGCSYYCIYPFVLFCVILILCTIATLISSHTPLYCTDTLTHRRLNRPVIEHLLEAIPRRFAYDGVGVRREDSNVSAAVRAGLAALVRLLFLSLIIPFNILSIYFCLHLLPE